MNDKDQIEKLVQENSLLDEDINIFVSQAQDLITEITKAQVQQYLPNFSSSPSNTSLNRTNINSQFNSSNPDFTNSQDIKSQLTKIFKSFSERNQKKIDILQQKKESEKNELLIKINQLEKKLKVQKEIIIKQNEKEKEYIKNINVNNARNEKIQNHLNKVILNSRPNPNIQGLLNENREIQIKNKYKEEIEEKDQTIKLLNDKIEKVTTQFKEKIDEIIFESNNKNETIVKQKELLLENRKENQRIKETLDESHEENKKLTNMMKEKDKKIQGLSKIQEEYQKTRNSLDKILEENKTLTNRMKEQNKKIQELSELKEEYQKTKSSLDELLEENKKLTNTMKEQNKKIQEFSKTQEEYRTIRKSLNESHEENEKLTNMMKEKDKKIQGLSKIQEEYQKTRNSLDKILEENKTLTNRMKEQNKKIQELSKTQEEYKTIKKSYAESLEENELLTSKTKEQDTKIQKLSEIEGKYKTIEKSLNESHEENEKLTNMMKEQNKKIQESSKMKEEYQKTKSSLNELLEENEKLTNMMKEKDKKIQGLSKIQEEYQKTRNSLDKILEENKTLTNRMKEQNKKIQEFSKKQEEYRTIRKSLNESHEENEKLTSKTKEQDIKIQELSEIEEKYKTIEKSLNESHEENEKLTNTMKEQDKKIQGLSKIQEEYKIAKKTIKFLIKKKDQFSNDNKTLMEELTKLKEKCSTTENDLNQKKEEFESEKEELLKEIEKLKKKDQLIQKENDKLKIKNKKHHHFNFTDYLIDLNDYEPVLQKTDNDAHSILHKIINKKTLYTCVMKKIKETNSDKISDLVKILSRFQHSSIIEFFGYSTHDFNGNKNFSIIMEYAQKESLQDIFRLINIGKCPQNFTNTSRQIILIGIARSMMIFHKNKVFLGNLKPSNILLDEYYYPHLTDFYESKLNNDNQTSKSIYSDPQSMNKINKKSDVYSFGLIMFEIVTNKILLNPKLKCSKMLPEKARPKFPDNINSCLKQLIQKCWSFNLFNRPSFEEIFYLLAYDKKYRLDNVDENEVDEYMKMIKIDLIFCNTCNQKIDKSELVYYSGFPYHESCVECQVCKKAINSSLNSKYDDFISITPGFFLCQQHYTDYLNEQNIPQKISKKFNEQKKKNITKELVDFPVFDEDNITEYEPNDIFIDSWMIENSFTSNSQYNLFFPTVTFHFSKFPSEIEFEKLKSIFGDNFIITEIKKGSTLVIAAFLNDNMIPTQVLQKYDDEISSLKGKLDNAIGKAIVGNLIDPPMLKNEEVLDINLDEKHINLLQNAQLLDKIELKEIKSVIAKQIQSEITFKNLNLIFKQNKIFDEAEKQVRSDISKNPYEMVITAHTIIANKYFNEYNEIKSKIPKSSIKEVFLYHGTRLANHCKIIKKHFLMPGYDNTTKIHKTDDGFYGKGIYATENILYASMYSNSFKVLNYNEKASIFCCRAIYNKDYVLDLEDLSYDGKMIPDNISSNYGIHHALVGSSKHFCPINKSDVAKNSIVAEEFVFPTKYQIIPICSFIVTRKDYFILWKDEHIDNNENKSYMEDLMKAIEVNIYFEKNLDEAIKLVKIKKRNKIKLITNGGEGLTGKIFIEECRKIVKSNFVCLVFAKDTDHLKWVTKMENVLFTHDSQYFKNFAAMKMEKDAIIKFANDLEKINKVKFNINEDSLLDFPLFNRK